MRLAFWRRKSVAEHLAPITDIVTALTDHAAFHTAKQEQHLAAVKEHQTHAGIAAYETELALTQATKIAGLI